MNFEAERVMMKPVTPKNSIFFREERFVYYLVNLWRRWKRPRKRSKMPIVIINLKLIKATNAILTKATNAILT